jgi:hypothetical protein
MATQHPVTVPDRHGIYSLPLWHEYKDGRATDNFLATPFRHATGHWVRFELTNVPPEELAALRCVIRADQAGRPDPARSPVVTNGEAFWLQAQSSLDRNFYVATVGWTASNLLQRAPEATARILLLEAPRGTNAVSGGLGR